MERPRPLASRFVLCLLPSILALAGCGKKIWITQYPAFYTPDLRSIVVVPFHNATHNPVAADVITDKVAAALMANRTYRVFSRRDLPALAGTATFQVAGGDTDAIVRLLRKRRKVQAILTGTVTTYASVQHRDWRERSVDDKRDRKRRRRPEHREHYWHYRNEATADAVARLIRVSDGAAIHATPPGKAKAKVVSESASDGLRPPEKNRQECLAAAGDQCVAELMEEFAIVRKQIRVGRKALRTAAGFQDGEWHEGETFGRAQRKVYVVLDLPAECDRNRFRIAIVREGSDAEIASTEFIWQRDWSDGDGKGFPFNLAEIAREGGGPGNYSARLCSGADCVLATDFEIDDGG